MHTSGYSPTLLKQGKPNRTLLLEMETGINNGTDTVTKIKSYNRVIRTNAAAWTGAYGNSPRVLVVVPSDSQLEFEALKWRHYFYKQETAVLLTSLQTLARLDHGKGWGTGWRRESLQPG